MTKLEFLDKIEKWLLKHSKEYVCTICDGSATSVTYESENLIKDLRKALVPGDSTVS